MLQTSARALSPAASGAVALPRVTSGRPTKRPEQVSDAAQAVIDAATSWPGATFETWHREYIAHCIDSELEELTKYVMGMDVDVRSFTEVMAPAQRGDVMGALNALVFRMKQRFRKELRDFQRSDFDAYVQLVDDPEEAEEEPEVAESAAPPKDSPCP